MNRYQMIPPALIHDWKFDKSLIDIRRVQVTTWGCWGSKKESWHCFTDDWRFESIWRSPENSLRYALDREIITSPDYTIRPNWPIEAIRWQLWRSQAITRYWQANGVNVVPCYNWTSVRQIDNCLGLYQCSPVIAVRSPGREYFDQWFECAFHIQQYFDPSIVLQFGSKKGSHVWKNCINLKIRSRI